MLSDWLKFSTRNPCPYSQFDVIDLEEEQDLSPEVRSHLADLISEARFSAGFLAEMAESPGWDQTKAAIAGQMPRQRNARRGEFGEVLISAILRQFHEYKLPVPKLRFKITSDQSLPSTDVLAIKLDPANKITEVCFVESKLRTSASSNAAVEGCTQLQSDYNAKWPSILVFIANQLYERDDLLFPSFLEYLKERNDTTEIDSFRLSLCWEHTAWRETVLENLQESDVGLKKLAVHVIRIKGLEDLTDDLFTQLGIVEVSDNE